MKDDNKRELKPKLRFPEFRDAPEWEAKPIGDICEILNSRRLPISSDERKAGPYPYYGASGIVDYVDGYIFDERLLLVGEDGAKWGAFEKTAFIADGKYWVNNHAHVLKGIEANDTFLENYLTLADLGCFVTGTAPPKLTLAKLRGIPVPVPPYAAEQLKIADCLSSLDDLIAAHSRKLDALEAHKEGLMQQLFPRKGETLPRLRFPEFQDAPEWKVKPLEQVATYENGRAHENNISEDGQYIVVNSKFISTEGEVRKYSNDAFCMADSGDILMVLSDVPNGKAIAKCFFVEADNLYAVNQRICKIRPVGIDGKLLFKILDRNPFFLAFDDGVKQTNLRKEDVLNCPICFPRLPEEQKKIGDSISSLDELITAQSLKLDTLKTHKNGLMQQLFPSPEEVEA